MKFLSKPWVKAALVAVGLFAVFMAYRPNQQSTGVPKVAVAPNYGSGKSIRIRLPQQSSPSIEEGLYPDTRFSKIGGEVQATQTIPKPELPIESIEPSRVDIDSDLDLDPVATWETSVDDSSLAEVTETKNSAQPVDYREEAPATTPMPTQSPQLDEVAALRAVHHIEYGKSLARRNATAAASHEFLGALRVLAEANDEATSGNAYISALRTGLLAIKEASDFKSDDPNGQISMDVARIIEGHETRAIGKSEAQSMGASAALRRYFEYAGHQLGQCGGQNPVAAEALYCLGKMKTVTSQMDPDPESTVIYEAIIFHHASMSADPQNFRSANELGVLLARTGHLDAAETYLKNSLKISPTPQGWANLAKVHQRKGTPQDQQLANLAMQEYRVAVNMPPSVAVPAPIQMVDPQEFIARSPMQHPSENQAVQVQQQVMPVANEQAEEDPSFVQRIGSLFTNRNKQR